MLVPWREVKSWHCTACGRCCREYRVPLRFYEYLKLRATGFVEERFGKFYIKKIGKMCPFQVGRLCSLQGNNKPTACKLYPFMIEKRGDAKAEFEYKGETFYVYVDVSTCPNIVLGKAGSAMHKLVTEAVQVYLGEKKSLEFITAPLANDPPHKQKQII
jgi:Fe-S-cluster containining protein